MGRAIAELPGPRRLPVLAGAFEVTFDPDAPPVYEEFGFTTGPTAVPVRLRHRAAVA